MAEGTLITVRASERSVKVDVTDTGAKQAKAYGRSEQLSLAQSIAALLGFEVDEQPLIQVGKRGVANRGFSIVLWKKEQA